MNSPAARSDVIAPVNRAWEHMQQLLFRPFDLARWLAIGFTAWLATLGQTWGGGGGGGGNFQGNGRWNGGFDIGESTRQVREWVSDNLLWLVPTVLVVGILVVTIWLVVLWLSSRGQFMFLHNVVTARADVVAPWNAYSAHGNSLFVFRLVVALVSVVAALPILTAGAWAGYQLMEQEGSRPIALAVMGVSALVIGGLGLGYVVVGKLTRDFVVPIMWQRTASCRAGWSIFLGLARDSFGPLILYFIVQMVLWIAAGILIVALVLVTCCMAGCIIALPYLGTVLLLPVEVFFRSYSLQVLAQQGAEWDLFRSANAERFRNA